MAAIRYHRLAFSGPGQKKFMTEDQIRLDDGASCERMMGMWSRLAGAFIAQEIGKETSMREAKTRFDIRLKTRRELLWAATASIGVGLAGARNRAGAQSNTVLKVSTFPGVTNVPIFAAEHKGFFAKNRLTIDLVYTPNSRVQRDGLAKGDYQVIQTAADNCVAMVELDKTDAIIVAGGDNGFNHIIVQPEINRLSDLRDKTVVVDAPNTAFALLLYKALKDSGLNKGDYKVNSVGGTGERLAAMTGDKTNVAAIMGLPFIFSATAVGLKDLGSAYRSVGAYQSDSAVVMHEWAAANRDSLVRYIKAVVEGRRWLLDPANKAEATQLLADNAKVPLDMAAKSYAMLSAPDGGYAKDAKFDLQGFENVLKLRAEIEGQWGGNPPPPEKYIDLSYYDQAIAGL
jgi:ABC-type nitrate/sulfonate/bicarbonate transport system substrate-binding protein